MSKARDSVEDLKTLDANLAAKLPKAGGTMTGDTLHGDNVKAKFGTGGDLEIYHDGSDSIIADVGNGDLKIKASNDLVLSTHDGEAYIACVQNGAVKLYYDRSAHSAAKLETSATGASVTGTMSTGKVLLNDNGNSTIAGLQLGNQGIGLSVPTTDTMHFLTADQTRMMISSTGNVGIGNSSPSTKLHISGSANNDRILIESPHSVGLVETGLEMRRSTTVAGAKIQTVRHPTLGGLGLDFYTTANGAAEDSGTYSKRVSIDSAGRVTMPYQPSFVAKAAGGWRVIPTAPTKAAFSNQIFDTNNDFNPSTYLFTAPVSGVYAFTFQSYTRRTSGGTGDYMYKSFLINGALPSTFTETILHYADHAVGDLGTSLTAIFSLSANDTVAAATRASSTNCAYHSQSSTFAGYLIG